MRILLKHEAMIDAGISEQSFVDESREGRILTRKDHTRIIMGYHKYAIMHK